MARQTRSHSLPYRPVLYPLGRVDERFVPGGTPVDLADARPLTLGRLDGGVERRGHVLVDDPWMSLEHARIVDGTQALGVGARGAPGRLFIEDLGSKNGINVNGVRSPRAPLIHGDIVETGRTFWVYVEERLPEPLLAAAVEVGAFVTWHPTLGAQLGQLVSRARTADHALISGPDGSGKGFLARTLHQVSRREGRFLHLACHERRPRKIAVELFGMSKGEGPAGRLRDAGGGTLLLEHVESLAPELQTRLADVLTGRRGTTTARVVGTVSGDPRALLADGRLRPELVEALGALRVDLPPLDERLCDLGLLLDDFLTRAKGATGISREACRVLFRHHFNQHVRGFARVVEAAASLAADELNPRPNTIDVQHLPFSVAGMDALRALQARAAQLAELPKGQPELTNAAVPALSATGDDGAPVADHDDDAADDVDELDDLDDGGFSSVIETEAAMERPSLSSAVGPRRRGTASAIEQPVFADPQEVDADAVTAALRATHGNVSAAARMLARPRALVLRWIRELGLDPLSFR